MALYAFSWGFGKGKIWGMRKWGENYCPLWSYDMFTREAHYKPSNITWKTKKTKDMCNTVL